MIFVSILTELISVDDWGQYGYKLNILEEVVYIKYIKEFVKHDTSLVA